MDLVAFVGVSAAVILTPGQDTALTIKNTLQGGRAGGIATALGVAAGQAVWAAAASLGLASLLMASEPAFAAMRLFGAVYVAFLGVRILVGLLRDRATTAGLTASPRISRTQAFRQGAVSNLGNPEMVVFFTSLLPQFAPLGDAFGTMLALGLAFCVMTLAWLAGYALVVARAGAIVRRSRIRRSLDAAMGGVLVLFGLRLATGQR